MVLGRSDSRVSKDGCWFCRLSGLSPYIGGDRAGRRTTFVTPSERRHLRLLPRPARAEPGKRRRNGAGGRDKLPVQRLPRTQCVECLLKWLFPPFRQLKLPIFEGICRRAWMHSLFFSSSNRLTYFFDPRTVRTLGSLARTTVVPREFRQLRLFRPCRARPPRAPLTSDAAISCAALSHHPTRLRRPSSQNNHIVWRDDRARHDRHSPKSRNRRNRYVGPAGECLMTNV